MVALCFVGMAHREEVDHEAVRKDAKVVHRNDERVVTADDLTDWYARAECSFGGAVPQRRSPRW
jgi:hypothetical protein